MRPSTHHLAVRKRSLCLCLLLIAQAALNESASFAANSQTAEPLPLRPGSVLQREIGGGETHAYAIELSATQYVCVQVNQQGSDAVLIFFDLDGNSAMVDRPNGSRGRETLAFIAPRAGTVRVEVRTLARSAPRGQYEILIAEQRAATPRDESRIVAERAVTEGEILRARMTALSLPQALEKFDQAVALWRALDDRYEVAVALYGRCLTYRQLGDSERAVADCGESMRVMRALGDGYGEAVAQTGRAWAYLYLGDTERALTDYTASLAARRRLDDRQGEPLDLYGIGWCHALRGEHEAALDYFRRSIALLDTLNNPRARAIRLSAIGEIHRRMNRHEEAITYLAESLRLARTAGDDRGNEAETLLSLGWCRIALNQLTQAKDCFTESLALRRAIGDRTGEAVTLLGLAHAEREQGNLHNARLHIEAALTIIESLRAQVTRQSLRLTFFALAQDYYEFYIDLLMQMRRLDPARGYAAAALQANERARARSLLDMLGEARANVRADAPAELIARERTLRSRLNAAANYQRQLISENQSATLTITAQRDVDDLTAELSHTEAEIRRASPRYAVLTRPQPLSAVAIQREVVDADTLLLEYALGRERSFLWAVTPSEIAVYELPARREIEAATAHVRELLTARDVQQHGETPAQKRARIARADAEYPHAAMRLSRMILAPAIAHLGAVRLIIVAPGTLQLVSFAALPHPAPPSGSGAPLIASHEIVILPSASTMAMLRGESSRHAQPARLVTIFADPVFSLSDERFAALHPVSSNNETEIVTTGGETGGDTTQGRMLPRLFRTRWEAEQIAALAPRGAAMQVLDFTANREAAASEINRSRIIHFATHALVNDTHPELSGIALSMYDRDGRARDGFLRAHDIFNLRLSAELVVLSACRTALGRDFNGEGLVGLARGFMYAGAPRFVGSLWATDDRATAELMVRFYRKMLGGERLRAAAALRAAQIEMWRDSRWRAPYFWAGFTLQGEWR